MTDTVISGNPLESILNEISHDVSYQSAEDDKITSSRLKVRKDNLRDQREARIENLQQQAKQISQGGCFKFIRSVFKIVDLLAKPLSLLTGNQLKLTLSKTMDMLHEAKQQGRLLGLKINAEQISQFISNIKKQLSLDMDALKDIEAHDARETQRILQILDEIDQTFKSTQH